MFAVQRRGRVAGVIADGCRFVPILVGSDDGDLEEGRCRHLATGIGDGQGADGVGVERLRRGRDVAGIHGGHVVFGHRSIDAGLQHIPGGRVGVGPAGVEEPGHELRGLAGESLDVKGLDARRLRERHDGLAGRGRLARRHVGDGQADIVGGHAVRHDVAHRALVNVAFLLSLTRGDAPRPGLALLAAARIALVVGIEAHDVALVRCRGDDGELRREGRRGGHREGRGRRAGVAGHVGGGHDEGVRAVREQQQRGSGQDDGLAVHGDHRGVGCEPAAAGLVGRAVVEGGRGDADNAPISGGGDGDGRGRLVDLQGERLGDLDAAGLVGRPVGERVAAARERQRVHGCVVGLGGAAVERVVGLVDAGAALVGGGKGDGDVGVVPAGRVRRRGLSGRGCGRRLVDLDSDRRVDALVSGGVGRVVHDRVRAFARDGEARAGTEGGGDVDLVVGRGDAGTASVLGVERDRYVGLVPEAVVVVGDGRQRLVDLRREGLGDLDVAGHVGRPVGDRRRSGDHEGPGVGGLRAAGVDLVVGIGEARASGLVGRRQGDGDVGVVPAGRVCRRARRRGGRGRGRVGRGCVGLDREGRRRQALVACQIVGCDDEGVRAVRLLRQSSSRRRGDDGAVQCDLRPSGVQPASAGVVRRSELKHRAGGVDGAPICGGGDGHRGHGDVKRKPRHIGVVGDHRAAAGDEGPTAEHRARDAAGAALGEAAVAITQQAAEGAAVAEGHRLALADQQDGDRSGVGAHHGAGHGLAAAEGEAAADDEQPHVPPAAARERGVAGDVGGAPLHGGATAHGERAADAQ